MPLAIAVLPSLGMGGNLGEGFELAFVCLATGLGFFNLLAGYGLHRSVRALSLLMPGLLLIWSGVLSLHEAPLAHAIAMTLGGTLVGLAHLANLRLHAHDSSCAH